MKKNWYIYLLIVSFITITCFVYFKDSLVIDEVMYKFFTLKMNDVLTNIYKVITFFGSTLFIVIATIVLTIFFIFKGDKKRGIFISGAIIISTIFNNIIKIIIRRERPLVLKLVIENTFSFPSGHTMASFTLYGALFYLLMKSDLDKRLKISGGVLLVILPILIGISRIYLGAHYFTDVISGAILSITLLILEIRVLAKYKWL